ncbi:FG-GAP-like repeat-containing protein [Flavobacteriaceae bacterium]|nr:FG-GAP-like repeat-containing protein [Flavobacteriaceae bacterium]
MKKLLLLSFTIFSLTNLIAQPSFTNRNDLIDNNYNGYTSITVDMNGDYTDDFVRVSENGVGIDYQQADGTFESVFISMIIQWVPDWSAAAADIDGNGYTDLLLGNGQRASFLFANEDGTDFTEVFEDLYIFSQRTNIVDIDNDGDLDAFVCHDVDGNHNYRNDGNQNMVLDFNLIETLNLAGNYASLWVDYDNDGDTDMHLTKCRQGSTPGDPERTNAMYRNNGDGTYTEVAAAINLDDNEQSWATVWQDFDNDGDFDAFCVNHSDANRFYENDGTGVFTDIIVSTGINPTDLGAWENHGADFDNDGYVDIFSEMARELYMNNGDMTFTGYDLPFDEGAVGDFNGDGYLDVGRAGDLWMNDGGTNNWVKFALVGVESNLHGIGARITINGDWGTQIREVRSGTGYSHMSTLIAHFGLGTSTEIESVLIEWPSGTVDLIENVDINTQHVFIEGENVLGTSDFALNGISLYPNPTSAMINFSLKNMEGTPVRIIDVNGRTVLKTSISSDNSINIETLTNGVYFVQLQIENKDLSYKFVKK